jgi:hypothetical protein
VRPSSGLLLVLDIAADDFGHVGVLLLGLLDEGGIVEALVIELDVLLALDRLARGLLLALRLGIGLFKGDELGLRGLRDHGFDLAHRSAGRLRPAATWRHHDGLEHRPAFRADDGAVIEVVKLGATMRAQALRTELRLCHGYAILKESLKSGSPLGVSRRLCQ